MGIRETINRNRQFAMGGVIAVIVICLMLIIMQLTHGRPSLPPVPRAFYSDDDGKTWFIDDGQKIVPFDHNGKEAVRARVFRCSGGELFVAYLERYSDAIKSRILDEQAQHPGDAAPDFSLMPMDVKKPGESSWISPPAPNAAGNEYRRITTPVCPNGGTDGLSPVFPTDSDNGASS